MSELWTQSIGALHGMFRTGEASPVDLLQCHLERTERLDPELNTLITPNPEARAAAEASESRYRAGTPLSPLDGITCTIKDNILVRDLRCTWGSAIYADHVPSMDEVPVARLRAAGAVIMGKTNVPEFTIEGYTGNATFGVTGNAWNPALTPGGSSGGAVSGVAAGLASFALGTDGGGSIRRPAGHCGLIGLKPSTGRVARVESLPQILGDREVIGPLARRVDDAALVYEVIAGPDPADPLSWLPATPKPSFAPFRVLYVERFGNAPLEPIIAASTANAARAIEALGHIVEAGAMPLDVLALEAEWPKIAQIGMAWLASTLGDGFERAGANGRRAAANAHDLRASEMMALLELTMQLKREAGRLFETIDAIMTPAAAAQPWPKAEPYPTMIDGQAVGPRGHALYTGWVNALGLPGLTLPAEPDAHGMPIGYQLIAGFGREDILLRLAREIEAAASWHDRWPALARLEFSERRGSE